MRTRNPRLGAIALLAVLQGWSLPTYSDDDPSTVGKVASDNGLTADGLFRVKTPSIMRIEMSAEIPPDINVALEHYDRIAELPNVNPGLRAEAMRRGAYLRVQRFDAGEENPESLQHAIALYEQLLKDVPDDPGNDRALYQLARAYQLNGDAEKSIDSLLALGKRFPQSALIGDGLFRAGEQLFVRARYEEAEQAYAQVVAIGPSTPFYETADYKYGWSLYRQAKYDTALPVFIAILERTLPVNSADQLDKALAGADAATRGKAGDVLHAASLAAVGIGPGAPLNQYFDRHGEPAFSPLIYRAEGTYLLGKQRYTDAAATYTAYRTRHPKSDLSPEFQTLVIQAYTDGGFADLVLQAKEQYANDFAPNSPYWAGRTPSADVLATTRTHFDDIARHYQSLAQRSPAGDPSRTANFLKAADWYARTLALFPIDARTPQVHVLYADALLDGGKLQQAAAEYTRAAYEYSDNKLAPEAAFAAVQVYQRIAQESDGAARDAALKQSIDASLQLVERLPQHPKGNDVLTQSAEDLLTLKQPQQAIDISARVLATEAKASPELIRRSLSVTADAYFELKQYEQAEAAYTQLLARLSPNDERRPFVAEQLAASAYKQGEAARDAGDLRLAAQKFLRVGQVAPASPIRANADYDAAAAFAELKDWPATAATLEAFRQRYPQHTLIGDVDKRLAYAYEQDEKWRQAADVYARIAERNTETLDTRRDSAWLAATYYDKSTQPVLANQAYERYVDQFAQPVDRAMQARRRLADIARDNLHDRQRYQRWLTEIVTAGEGSRDPGVRIMVAQANLEIGRDQAMTAKQLALSLPLEKSLPVRLQATQQAIATLSRAAESGDAETTTAATFELGSIYRDFGRAILASSRPPGLSGDALDQYNVLLEEQAFPFEEKAIKAYEANLMRVRQGIWNDWVRQSARALVEIAPAQYGKQDQRDPTYESLL